jgi:hypothetical protein
VPSPTGAMSKDTMAAAAQALQAALADDLDAAVRILGDFPPAELRALQRACGLLGVLCIDVRRDPLPAPGPVIPTHRGPRRPFAADQSGVAGPGAAGAARTSQTSPSPLPTSEGGADVASPELGAGASN